jgi:uncharacterized membrane protein HdeD (DUF308 family)
VGVVILIPVILKIIELPELSAIVVSFIGLATVLNGAVNIGYKFISTKNNSNNFLKKISVSNTDKLYMTV